MACDAEFENKVRVEALEALGLAVESRLAHFHKRISGASDDAAKSGVALHRLELSVLSGAFAICKLASDAPLPAWALAGDLFSITRTPEELSIVCRQLFALEGIVCERDWRCLRVAGPIPFQVVGVLASLATTLADGGVSLFAVSTFDTDYLLVKAAVVEKAAAVLRAAGHVVRADAAKPA